MRRAVGIPKLLVHVLEVDIVFGLVSSAFALDYDEWVIDSVNDTCHVPFLLSQGLNSLNLK